MPLTQSLPFFRLLKEMGEHTVNTICIYQHAFLLYLPPPLPFFVQFASY